jgi:hypothetical protein
MCKRIVGVALAILIVFSVCSGLVAKPRSRQIPNGSWGGPGIRIEIQGGSATIEYDCANGTIEGPLKLDRSGKFKLSGTHIREHAGPVRVDQPLQNQPARYSGWTDGRKMTLVVTLANTKEEVGTFTLLRGQTGKIRKCR